MNSLLVYLVLSTIPQGGVTEVPLIEINSVYSQDDGRHRLTQLIVWDQQHGSHSYHVRVWCMKHEKIKIMESQDKNFPYLVFWPIDGSEYYRIIKAKRYKSTHTLVDPEEEDRKVFPIEARIPLH